jgi:Tfp pilus assembly protein PilN
MTLVKISDRLKAGVSKTGFQAARLSRFLWRILSLSLADDRVAPMRGLSVVLERGSIAVVDASRFLSWIRINGIRRYFFEKGKYPTPENVVSAVTLAANEFRITHAQVILVIPKSWTVIKTTDFPLSVTDNLSDVISYELDRLTPLRADRAFYDFQIIGQDESRLQVMVAAVNSDILQPYIEVLQGKKIIVRRIAVNSSALGTISQRIHGHGSVVFLKISEGGYEGGLIRDGKWRSSFTGNLSSSDEQACIRTIAGEVNPLIESIKKEEKNIEVIVDCPLSDKWCRRLRDSIEAKIRFIGETDLKLRFMHEDRTEVSYVAVGGALEYLWPQIPKINLLDQGRHKLLKTPVALTTVLICLLVALGLFSLASPLQLEKWKVEALDREIAVRKDNVKKVEMVIKDLRNVENDLAAIRAFKNSRPMALNMLKEMTRILPKNTWLTRIRIADSTIEIEGYAASATEIVPKLEASEYFKKVEFASSTLRDPRLNVDRFTIKMEIEGLPEEKVKDGKKK